MMMRYYKKFFQGRFLADLRLVRGTRVDVGSESAPLRQPGSLTADR